MSMLQILVIMLCIVVVNCYPFSDGDIRLVGGSSPSEGTVLVFHENKWGSICDYHWDIRDANVACRQLGYPRALQYIHGSRFGRGRSKFTLFFSFHFFGIWLLYLLLLCLFTKIQFSLQSSIHSTNML
jgi:hypothetical protein